MTEPTLESQLSGIPQVPDTSSRELLDGQLVGSKGLLLDIDDTIIDTRWSMTEAGVHGARALWPDRVDDHRAMSRHYYDDAGDWFREYAAGRLSVDAMRPNRLELVAREFGVDLPADGPQRYWAAYAPAFRAVQRLFDDVPALLAAAQDSGLPVGLLTNSTDQDTEIKLEALQLRERFDVVVTTDTLGVGKPDPRVYLEACRRLGVEPGLTVCIGDSLEWDVLGAMQAGLRAVWLVREGEAHAASDTAPERQVARVSTLRDVAVVLERLAFRRFGAGTVDR